MVQFHVQHQLHGGQLNTVALGVNWYESAVDAVLVAIHVPMRTSEGIALRWTNVDFRKKEMLIDGAMQIDARVAVAQAQFAQHGQTLRRELLAQFDDAHLLLGQTGQNKNGTRSRPTISRVSGYQLA